MKTKLELFNWDCDTWLYDGYVTFPDKGVGNDNPFIGNATREFIRQKLGAMFPLDETGEYFRQRLALSTTWLPKNPSSWSRPGLSHDDINALLCHGEEYANYLYHGAKFWSFNSEGTWKNFISSLYWRMGYLVPAIRAAAEKRVPWFEQKWYAWDIKKASEAPIGDTSTRCLYVLQSMYLDKFPPIMQKAMKEFLLKCNEQYGDISGLYKIYFWENHPFTIYTKGIKFV